MTSLLEPRRVTVEKCFRRLIDTRQPDREKLRTDRTKLFFTLTEDLNKVDGNFMTFDAVKH